ncbi:MAG: RagB/SusD family nutrient uptake outer membrane protein [Carboxylicivirga sp.]|nr:RagB/SusD family nutrient uptake outer membrane protein [Carboxylicivirga sp.]
MNKIKIYLVIVLGITIAACDDYLSTHPDARATVDSFEKVEKLLVNAYPNISSKGFTSVMSDNATDRGVMLDFVYEQAFYEAYHWKDPESTDIDCPNTYWEACYNAISHSNQALTVINEMIANGADKEEFKPLIAEARLARAYNHFMLVNIWAKHYDTNTYDNDLGITIMDKVEDKVFNDYKRNSVKEVYDFIRKDLEYIDDLNDNVYQAPKFRMNSAAAHTFATRFYTYTGEWAKVLEHANAALGEGNPAFKLRDLNGSYIDLGIFEYLAEWNKSEDRSNLLLTSSYSFWFYYLHSTSRYSMSNQMMASWFNQNPHSSEWAWKQFQSEGRAFIAKDDSYFLSQGLNAETGWYLVMSREIMIEEALFNRIEAKIMTEDYPGAIADLNAWYSTRVKDYDANVHVLNYDLIEEDREEDETNPQPYFYTIKEGQQKVMMQFLMDQRRREFAYDGLRWYDIKRFRLPVVHEIREDENIDDQTEIPTIELSAEDLRKVVQIPPFALNTGLKANPR